MATIELLVPTLATTLAGNSITADRYCRIFTELGHQTRIATAPTTDADLVVALNAYRSAAGIAAVAPDIPVVTVLTGTDVYRFIHEEPALVHASLQRATWLVGLNDRVGDVLALEMRDKLVIIKEGAAPGLTRSPDPDGFQVVSVGHLRAEKDPKLAANAVRDLWPIQIIHYGEAHTDEWARWAKQETESNPSWQWRGQVSRSEIAEIYATSHLLINTSRLEGGANVVSEAVMAGLPILASRIDGNVGVLGSNYPGYFQEGNPAALRGALLELSVNREYLTELTNAVEAQQSELSEQRELSDWSSLLDTLAMTP